MGFDAIERRTGHSGGRGQVSMKQFAVFILLLVLSVGAQADRWKWIDAHGHLHHVDSIRPIHTWLDESGHVHYSDKPGHKDARRVELIRVSGRSRSRAKEDPPKVAEDRHAVPGESEEEAHNRRLAEAYYCKRATDFYAQITEVGRLYETDADGERVYLSEEDSAQAIAKAKVNVGKWCS